MTLELVANPNIVEMEYAVRGPIPQRAAELAKQGRTIIPCNIGNPQALGQKPMTFYRQVLSLLEDPSRIARERRLLGHASDREDDAPSPYVLDFTESMLSQLTGQGLGAYSDSTGPAFIREAVARFIDRRDGGSADFVPADPDRIFLANGASEAVKNLFEILIAGPADGIMVPIPQYPLYSAVIRKCGGTLVEYHPDEASGWTLDRATLDDALATAQARGVNVKAIVVINPGNPTGAILPEESVRDVIAFAGAHGLIVVADEVYQENGYGAEFVSFAKTLGSGDVPLCSLHSASKGFYGECGRRGGYMEVRNAPHVLDSPESFLDLLRKQSSVCLCSNTTGHALMYLLASTPEEGSEPYDLFVREKRRNLDLLHQKALMIKEAFTGMAGVTCPGRVGAMYLFPDLGPLPAGTNDFDYCMGLLEKTGLCTVNGAGFGQAEGTHHLRIAFLPDKELLEQVLPEWIDFHAAFLAGGS